MPCTVADECEYFPSCTPSAGTCGCDCLAGECNDPVGWTSLLSALAQQDPHLVAVGFDDFLQYPNWKTGADMTPDRLAEMQSRLSWPSEWLSLVPTVYHDNFHPTEAIPDFPDLPLALDSMLFYYENSPVHDCSVNDNAADQVAELAGRLAAGRPLHAGVYFRSTSVCNPDVTTTSAHDLLQQMLADPAVDGATVYNGLAVWETPHGPCATPTESGYCAVRDAYAP
jgi:hypothetical protein